MYKESIENIKICTNFAVSFPLSVPNLSVNSTGLILQSDDSCNVISCQEGMSGGELDDLISANKGDFLENKPPQADQVRRRLRTHLHFWEKIGAMEPVLSILKEGYKLPLLTIPQSVLLRNNKSTFDNCSFVSKAIDDLVANQCIDIVDSQPWVVKALSVSVRDKGKKRVVLDLRHVKPTFINTRLSVKMLLSHSNSWGRATTFTHLTLKVLTTMLIFLKAIELIWDSSGSIMINQHFLFLTICHSVCQQPHIHLPNF